ncbi:MAG: polymorphic toxin type 50 domain-containing protein [Clostridiales bacterium]|nr:polymorphic toxin type 50 domain-containing protein [Clostridiales bacterium]
MGGGGGKGLFKGTRGARSNYTIQRGLQDKHIVGTNNYKLEISNGKTPSLLTEDAKSLLRERAGKGVMINVDKEWADFGRVIGKYYDSNTGTYVDTTKGFIHYDKKGGAHIVPSKPTGQWKKGG